MAGLLAPDGIAATKDHLAGCESCQMRFGWTEPTAETRHSKPRSEPRPHGGGDDELTPGTKLGRYLILSRLGAGGMGVVYLAFDPELDRKVALKVLRGDLGH